MSWSSTSPAREHRGLTRCRTRRQQHRHPQQLRRHRRHQRFSGAELLLLIGLLIPLGGTAGAGALGETFREPRPPVANERPSRGMTRQSSRGSRRGTASSRHPNGFLSGRSILRSTASVGGLSRERSFPTASLGTLVINRITTSWRTASRFSGREGLQHRLD